MEALALPELEVMFVKHDIPEFTAEEAADQISDGRVGRPPGLPTNPKLPRPAGPLRNMSVSAITRARMSILSTKLNTPLAYLMEEALDRALDALGQPPVSSEDAIALVHARREKRIRSRRAAAAERSAHEETLKEARARRAAHHARVDKLRKARQGEAVRRILRVRPERSPLPRAVPKHVDPDTIFTF